MRVTVRLFAIYREKAGRNEVTIDLEDGATVGRLAETIACSVPGLPEPARLVVAVNNEYQDHDFVLAAGDEAALIPPVSGG